MKHITKKQFLELSVDDKENHIFVIDNDGSILMGERCFTTDYFLNGVKVSRKEWNKMSRKTVYFLRKK